MEISDTRFFGSSGNQKPYYNTYTVAKLLDGKCWMTKSLGISNKTITSADSDVSSSYRIASSSSSGFNSYSSQSVYIYNGVGVYSWNTAVAGVDVSSGEAPYSICPKGWRLPTYDEIGTLGNAYEQNTTGLLTKSPGNFLSGIDYCQGSSCYPSSDSTEYWTSTANGSNQAWGYNIYTSSMNYDGGNGWGKGCGFVVRCVAR